jgi:transposase InsO family protein
VRRTGAGPGRQAARIAARDHGGQRHRAPPRHWTIGRIDAASRKPTDNGLIESFNGRLRDEFLTVDEFITMHDMRERLMAWQYDYNPCRQHGSLSHLTPSEFATMRLGQPKEAARL